MVRVHPDPPVSNVSRRIFRRGRGAWLASSGVYTDVHEQRSETRNEVIGEEDKREGL
jgi:hypothetical protein